MIVGQWPEFKDKVAPLLMSWLKATIHVDMAINTEDDAAFTKVKEPG